MVASKLCSTDSQVGAFAVRVLDWTDRDMCSFCSDEEVFSGASFQMYIFHWILSNNLPTGGERRAVITNHEAAENFERVLLRFHLQR